MQKTPRFIALMIAVLCAGGLFGFYFTMSFVIMPGFDASEPFPALHANQQIGRTTQGSLFFIVLLGTPLAIIAAMLLPVTVGEKKRLGYLGVALVGWIAMMVVTLTLNVPLNQQLDGLTIVEGQSRLAEMWAEYSQPWQKWNLLRVLSRAVSLIFCALACNSHSMKANEN